MYTREMARFSLERATCFSIAPIAAEKATRRYSTDITSTLQKSFFAGILGSSAVMMRMAGQKLVKIDLNWKKVTEDPLVRPDLFPGGRATCSMLAYHYFQARDLATGENSFFFIATGPLVGTGFPGSNKVALAGKSILNGSVVTDIMPGSFGPVLRSTGIDHLVITGQAKELSYVVIGEEGHVNIRPKPDLAGLTSKEVESSLKKLLGDGIAVISAGIAGERQSLYATLHHDGHYTGSSGLGSVLCSKNVKAIVVDELGEGIDPPVAEPEMLSSLAEEVKQSCLTTIIGKQLSTAGKFLYTDWLHYGKGIPAKNYHLNAYPDSKILSMEYLAPLVAKNDLNHCNCPVNCPAKIILQEEERVVTDVPAVVALGPQCGFYDLDKILDAVDRCYDLGLDPVAVGISLACLIELVKKKKLLTEEKIDWNYSGIYKFIDDFLDKKHSFSHILEKGGAFLMNKYREEFPGNKNSTGLPVDINISWGSLLQAATSNQGMPSRLEGSLVPFEFAGVPFSVSATTFSSKPRLLSFAGNVECLVDSLIWCHDLHLASFIKPITSETLQGKLQKASALRIPGSGRLSRIFQLEKLAKILQAVSGKPFTVRDILQIGERTWIMELMFSLREGRTADDDNLPRRFLEKKKNYRIFPGEKAFSSAVNDYYALRGLNMEKMPSSKTLRRLKIDQIL